MSARTLPIALGVCLALCGALATSCAGSDPGSRATSSGTGGVAAPTGGMAAAGAGSGASGATSAGGISGSAAGSGTVAGSGGSSAQGGTGATAGGAGAMGGMSGGAAGTAGSTPAGAGGSSPTPSSCTPATPTACTAPMVRITEIDVAATVSVNEDDAALKMLSISPIPAGGSRVAWLSNDENVHVSNLDCDDKLIDSFAIPGMDYGDILADDKGGVLLLTRDAQGGGTLNCGTPSNLCGTPPSPAIPCYDMYMVRFDGSTETWATKLSTSSAQLPPYSTGPTGAQTYFIWWYAHHGRLATDGTNFAGYYGSATSVSQMCTTGGNTAINIHQGDEMRVVSPSGMLLTGHNSFDWGCSHSGFEKIVWDPGASRFAMICRSDGFPQVGLNVNASKQVFAISATDSSVSNVVLSATAGSYWTLVTNMGTLHLYEFTSAGGTKKDIDLGAGTKPHLVKYGSHLLAAWVASGNTMVGQVLDATTGDKIGATVPIAAPSNQFQDFRDYSDGSAAYPAPGSSATKIKIVRVMPCSG